MTKNIQTSLFKFPKQHKSTKNINSRTPEDKAYRALQRHNIGSKLGIFPGGKPCQSIALDYVNTGHLLDTTLDTVCKRSNKTKPHHYYHYHKFHFYEYNSWIMRQILKESESKHAK